MLAGILIGTLIGVALTVAALMVLALLDPGTTPDPTWYPGGDES